MGRSDYILVRGDKHNIISEINYRLIKARAQYRMRLFYPNILICIISNVYLD